MRFVVPTIMNLVKEMRVELPWPTQVLIYISSFVVDFWYAIIAFIIFLPFFIVWYIKTESGKKKLDYLKLKIPIIGNIYQKVYLTQIAQSLSTLLVGKVPISSALRITQEVVNNVIYKDLLSTTVKEVEDGHSITKSFYNHPFIPPMFINLLAVGEQTGSLEEVLNKMIDFYTKEIDNLVNNLVRIIEPLILIIMGVAAGVIVSAILLPTFQIISHI
jgi:type IV pilus assembly protein PilC